MFAVVTSFPRYKWGKKTRKQFQLKSCLVQVPDDIKAFCIKSFECSERSYGHYCFRGNWFLNLIKLLQIHCGCLPISNTWHDTKLVIPSPGEPAVPSKGTGLCVYVAVFLSLASVRNNQMTGKNLLKIRERVMG